MTIRLTAADARKLGATVPKRAKKARMMNGLEARFAEQLEAWKLAGEICWWDFEPIRLRLADGCWFKPDFLSVPGIDQEDTSITLFETKGFMREAARIRIRVAAEKYPFFRFVIVRWKNSEWDFEEVSA